jgi:tRNA-modifying protein YgfZ
MEAATTEPWERVDALDDGRGSVDRSAERKLVVRGADARGWLGDLVTADVATLERGSFRRSLLLTPTGRIRADLWIGRIGDDAFLLLQGEDQPEPVEDVLRPYVLSSAVRMEDVTHDLSVMLFPGRDEIVTVARGDLAGAERELANRGALVVDEHSYEIWRIGRGDPRMCTDFEPGALPAEAGLERLIDMAKGCFLGQESVAKVRNLGHPPTVLRHLRSATVVAPGTPVLSADGVVGQVTSVALARRGGFVLISRVGWRAAEAALHSGDDSPMFPTED